MRSKVLTFVYEPRRRLRYSKRNRSCWVEATLAKTRIEFRLAQPNLHVCFRGLFVGWVERSETQRIGCNFVHGEGETMNDVRRTHGFTLVELMIVVALMGILSAIAVPNIMGQMPRYRLNGAARQVMSDLLSARMEAVSQNNEFRILFLDSKRYTILNDADNDGSSDAGETTETKDLSTDYSDVSIAANNDPVFQPRGTASNLATITLTNSAGTRNISISSTGRVKIN